MENQTYSEIVEMADYSEARMHYNVDEKGSAENPLDVEFVDATEEAVPMGCQCPVCGEWRMDSLWISDDETVTCATCGAVYEMPGTQAATGCAGYLCDECEFAVNCEDFTAAFAPFLVTAQALEIAGAFAPRCDF